MSANFDTAPLFAQDIHNIYVGSYIQSKTKTATTGIIFAKELERLVDNGFYNNREEHLVLLNLKKYYKDINLLSELLPIISKYFENAQFAEVKTHQFKQKNVELANTYFQIEDYTNARSNFEIAIIKEKKSTPSIFVASRYNDIGQTYYLQKMYPEAINSYDKALKELEASNKTEQTNGGGYYSLAYRKGFASLIIANKAKAQHAINRNIPLEKVFLSQLETNKDLDLNSYSLACFDLANYYYLKKEYQKASIHITNFMSTYRSFNNVNRKYLKGLSLQSKIAFAIGNISEGDKLFRSHEHLKDSIFRVEKTYNVQVAKLIHENGIQEKELAVERLNVKSQKSNTIYSLIGLLLISILLTFVSFLYFRSRKQRKEIAIQKEAIQLSLEQKKLLLKEVHHRVKNNLQIISSLMRSQALKSNNPEFKASIKESQNRIESIVHIHEQFYSTEDIENINLKTYTSTIQNHISESFNRSNHEVSFTNKLEEILVPIDIAIPYGLILNELLSNCFKHAFKDCVICHISIVLEKTIKNKITLIVENGGTALPANFNIQDNAGFGLELISGLAWQLRGMFTYKRLPESTQFIVTFNQKSTSK